MTDDISDEKWMSVPAYAKKKGLKSPQVVYNWIMNNKLKKGIDWREVEITKKKKEIRVHNTDV